MMKHTGGLKRRADVNADEENRKKGRVEQSGGKTMKERLQTIRDQLSALQSKSCPVKRRASTTRSPAASLVDLTSTKCDLEIASDNPVHLEVSIEETTDKQSFGNVTEAAAVYNLSKCAEVHYDDDAKNAEKSNDESSKRVEEENDKSKKGAETIDDNNADEDDGGKRIERSTDEDEKRAEEKIAEKSNDDDDEKRTERSKDEDEKRAEEEDAEKSNDNVERADDDDDGDVDLISKSQSPASEEVQNLSKGRKSSSAESFVTEDDVTHESSESLERREETSHRELHASTSAIAKRLAALLDSSPEMKEAVRDFALMIHPILEKVPDWDFGCYEEFKDDSIPLCCRCDSICEWIYILVKNRRSSGEKKEEEEEQEVCARCVEGEGGLGKGMKVYLREGVVEYLSCLSGLVCNNVPVTTPLSQPVTTSTGCQDSDSANAGV